MRRPRRVLLMMRPPERFRADYLILSLAFLLGVLGGHLAGGLVSSAGIDQLAEYLSGYSRSASVRPSPASVFFAYFRMPALLAALTFVSWGRWLILPAMAGHGFLLAFAVRSIASALGRGGVLIAFAAFGLRCCFVLPCCFYLAAMRHERAASGPESRRRCLFIVFACAAVLLAGCAAEMALGPGLFIWALAHIS